MKGEIILLIGTAVIVFGVALHSNGDQSEGLESESDYAIRMLNQSTSDQANALEEIFRNPTKFLDPEIQENALRLWRESDNVEVRYYALRAYARLRGLDALPVVKEAVNESEPMLRILAAYMIFEVEDPERGLEAMVPLAVQISDQSLRDEIWTVVSSYLRREHAFLYERRWPGVQDPDELLGLLKIELSDRDQFWQESEIRRNLREIYQAAIRYFPEHDKRPVLTSTLVDKGYLAELPSPVAGEDYSNIAMANRDEAFRIGATTEDGRRISVW